MKPDPRFNIRAHWYRQEAGDFGDRVATWNGYTPIGAAHIMNDLVNSATPPSSVEITAWIDGNIVDYERDEPIYTVGFNAHQQLDKLDYRSRTAWFG